MLKFVGHMECKGKTIAGIAEGEAVLFTFTDGTYTLLRVQPGYEGDPGDVVSEEWGYGEGRVSNDSAIAAGLLTAEELEVMRQQHAETARRRMEEWERRKYEELRAKFERPADQT